MPRPLTKSLFILGNDCPTKLFYSNNPKYANANQTNDFLKSLADGGRVVGELAKLYFTGGELIRSSDSEEALRQTKELLLRDNVVIFEAAVGFENLLCRVDVLVKEGNELQLIEVKAKSIDGNDTDPFRSASGGVRSAWQPYLLDVAFQRFILQHAYPEYLVTSWLMCVDRNQRCTVDGLYQLFKIENAGHRSSCSFIGNGTESPICREILKRRKVDHHIDKLVREKFHGRNFEEYIRWLSEHYETGTKIAPHIGVHCKSCEFRCTTKQLEEGLRDGFRECWSEVLGWSETDFKRPTVFDLYGFRSANDLITARRIALADLTEVDLPVFSDTEPGLHPSEMQRVRWKSLKEGRNESFLDTEDLPQVMKDWRYPLHFIDFETATPAVPVHRGLRPYESLAFQFSHHTLHEDGSITHTGEYLNTTPGSFPNFDFLRNLRSSLSRDKGTIFRYAAHENTIINHIIEQLDDFGRDEPDYEDLRHFACTISRPTDSQREPWTPGEREMVDLRELVARHYYHPRMRGSQSIKYVLPAVLIDSKFLREKYSQPSYGYEIDPRSSRNFARQAWIPNGEDTECNPYKLLPNVFEDIDKTTWDESWMDEQIQGGGAAMAAYLRLQQKELPEGYREKVNKGLLRYCELDTLAMVMIMESWLNHPGVVAERRC